MKGVTKKMGNIKNEAQSYERSYKNITELASISVDLDLTEETRNADGKDFTVKFFLDSVGAKVTVPAPVLEQIKQILLDKPEMKHFRVRSSGTGKATKYTTAFLD